MLTTTLAREITPTPVMMIPKGRSIAVSPRKPPPNERMTEVMIMSGWEKINVMPATREMRWLTFAKPCFSFRKTGRYNLQAFDQNG